MGGDYSCCVNPQVPKGTALRNRSSGSTQTWLCEAIELLIHLLGSDTCNDRPSLQPLTRAPLHEAAGGISVQCREQAEKGPKAG